VRHWRHSGVRFIDQAPSRVGSPPATPTSLPSANVAPPRWVGQGLELRNSTHEVVTIGCGEGLVAALEGLDHAQTGRTRSGEHSIARRRYSRSGNARCLRPSHDG
jgi:hypothetical protein